MVRPRTTRVSTIKTKTIMPLKSGKKNQLPFNKCLDEQLLKLVEKHPILYDPTHPKHMDLDSRDTVWQQIGETLNRPAMEFAAIQCQIHFGDFQEDKHKPGLIENLKEYLPEQYSSSWGAEKKILKLYRKHHGLSHLEAKHLYTRTARELPTYGVTFFVVKEKQKGKKKMVPRLLGINSESILRLDEVTKEILQVWPLTHVRTYHAGKNESFTLNFGDYSDEDYSVKTNDAYRIRDILEGYIDIIRKRLCGLGSGNYTESGAVMQDCVQSGRANEMTHVSHTASKIVEHSFVGPTKILPFEQGQQGTTGTQMMTVQQVIVTNKGTTDHKVLSGEVPLRSDMSRDLVKKLNRMNSNAVKIVTLLTEPNEGNVQQARSIMITMTEDMPIIQAGIKEAAEKQSSEEAKKKLLDQLNELNALVASTAQNMKSDNMNPEDVQDQARQIADLTTQMYFAINPVTQRRSQLCRRSRPSFIEDEKIAATLRRASFIAAAGSASHAVDSAKEILKDDYQGAPLSAQEVEQLEAASVDKLGKLSAAVALFLNAHADSKNIDYEAAVNSMNTVKELLPELATDAKAISHAKGGDAGKEILDEVKALIDAARKVCMLTGCDDHEKIQEAAINYGDVSGRLVYIFGSRNPRVNADKENEIMELAKAVGDATTLLLVKANELTEAAASEGGAAAVDDAGVVCADAARDLLATAQLTSPTILEPHCQSALTASAETLSTAAQRLALAWKPLVDAPHRQPLGDDLATCTMELAKALDRLKNAYTNLGDMDVDEPQEPVSPEQAKKLQFIATLNRARGALKDAQQDLDKPITPAILNDREMNDLQDRISQKLAQNNAAVASLLQAKSDPQNPDYNTAELAISTISEVTPEVVEDARALLSSCPEERVRRAMLEDFRAWCRGADDVCASAAADQPNELDEASKRFAKASKKLSFAFSPLARKAREQLMKELFDSAHAQAMQMVDDTNKMADTMGGAGGDKLRHLGRDVQHSARAMQTTLMVTAPSLEEERCRSALLQSSLGLAAAARRLTSEAQALQDDETGCRVLSAQLQQQRAHVAQHADKLQRALQAIRHTLEEPQTHTPEHVESPAQKINRLKFINSASAVREKAREVEQLLEKPVEHIKLNEDQATELENKRARELAAVNAAIALLINAKNDRNNPNYNAAEEAMDTISELMPGIVNDTKALSAACEDEKARARMLHDIRAWCDAIRAVCASAGHDDLKEFVDTAQHYADTSDKLNFVFNPRNGSPKEKQVMQLCKSACSTAQTMVSDTHGTAGELPAAAAAELRVRALDVTGAAHALATTAQLTAPCMGEARSRAALLATSQCLGDAADELVSHSVQHPDAHCKELGTQLTKRKEDLDKALGGIKDTCSTENTGDVNVDGQQEQMSPQKLQFNSTLNKSRGAVQGALQHLDKPIKPASLNDREINDLQDRISQNLAQNNAAVALLVKAKSDPQNSDYNTAEVAISTISKVTPEVVEDACVLLSSCPDERARRAMLEDFRAWCRGADDVCASAAAEHPTELDEASKSFAKASKKLSFAFSPHARKAREQLMKELFDSAHAQAMQMVDDTNKMADTMGGAGGDKLRHLGRDVQHSARAMQTTLMVTAPSLEEERCRSALLQSSLGLAAAARRLTSEAQALQDDETGCRVLSAQLQQQRAHVVQHADKLQRALQAIQHTLEEPQTHTQHVENPTQKVQRLKFITSTSAVQQKAQEVEQLLEKPVEHSKLNEEQAKELDNKRARELAAVNAAIALLINAKNDRNNPNYNDAEEAMDTVSELMPGIINDTKALSAVCEDEKSRARMLHDIRAWCDAIRAVCASAGHDDLTEFVDSAQHFADTSDKLNFVFNPRIVSPREQQVTQLCQSACSTAKAMVEDTHGTASTLPAAAAAELRVRACDVTGAAHALATTAQLTAPCMGEARSRAALLATSQCLGDAADELVSHSVQHPDAHCKELGTQLTKRKEDLDKALGGIKDACIIEGTDAVENPTRKAQRLKFISGISAVQEKLDTVDNLLDQPTHGIKLTEQQAKDVKEKLAQDVARVNTSVASLLRAKSDVQNPDYVLADQAIETISELGPAVAKETKALSTACKDEKVGADMIRDMHTWCDDIRAVCASAEHDNPEDLDKAVQKLGSTSGKMKFIVSCRRNPMKESEVIEAAERASEQALQMACEAERVARSLPGAAPRALLAQACAFKQQARTLRTTAQLTAPSIHEPVSQVSLVGCAEALKAGGGRLAAQAARGTDPALAILGAELHAHQDRLAQATQDLRDVCTNKKISPATLKKQQLKFVTSANVAEKKAKEVEKLLDQPASDVKLSEQGTKNLQEKLSKAMAQVNAALASLVNAKSDPHQPNYAVAEKSFATISELLPEIISDTKDLSVTCKDEAARAAMVEDTRAWCDAIRAVCASAASDNTKDINDSTLKFCNASQKLRFVNNARKNPVKEQQIKQLSSSACDKAKQMVDETRRVASTVKTLEAEMLLSRADTLNDAAVALHTTAQLTAPSIHEASCQAALLSSADALSGSAQVLVRDTARAQHPAARRLSEEVDRYRDIMDRALQGLKTAIVAEDKRGRAAPPPPPKRTSGSGRAAGDRRSSGAASAGEGPPQSPRVRVVSHSNARRASQEWLHHMREEATRDLEATLPPGALTCKDIAALNKKADEERLIKEKFEKAADKAEESMQMAEQDLKQWCERAVGAAGAGAGEEQLAALHQQLEHKLALANTAAARLVASTHPDIICYATATQATESLSELVPDIAKDAALLSNMRNDEKTRRALLDHIRALSEASKRLVSASRRNNQEVNEAAVEFGDKSAGLLYVVAAEVDPAQEKGVITLARGIGDVSSSLAAGGAGLAGAVGGARATGVCDAGRELADAARNLVYTAKLVAPTVHHQQCQNSLITASHELSSQLKNFSGTWRPLASESRFAEPVAEMTVEAENLEKLLESFRRDLAAGKLVKRREVEKIVVEDTPLRRLASQIMDLAQMRAGCGNTADDKKKTFNEYAGSLGAALRALDLANSRYTQHPTDLKKHQDLEGAVQNLQINLLQSRPSLGDHPQNNVVDLTDFVKDTSKEAEKLVAVANETDSGKDKKQLDDIKADCHQINLNAFKLLNPEERQDGDETSLDGILEVDQFGQDCENRVQNIKSIIEEIKEKDAKDNLKLKSMSLIESCNYLRFATKSALATAQSASLDETLEDLIDLENRLDKMLVPVDSSQSVEKVESMGVAELCAARSGVVCAAGGLWRGAATRLPAALAAYVAQLRARTNLHDAHHRNRAKEHLRSVIGLLKQLTARVGARVATWQPIPCPQLSHLTEQLIKELENVPVSDATDGEKSHVRVLNEADINRLLMPADVKIEGEPKLISEKLQQTAGKLVMLSDTLAQSAARPESLARTAPALTEAALLLAAHARSLPPLSTGQAKRKEEASQEMCWATYNLLKSAELVSRSTDATRGDARGRLRAATRALHDSINKLARSAHSGDKLGAVCGEAGRALQAAAGAQLEPRAAPPYNHCLQALHSQRDALNKMNNDEPMPREEFSKSLNYVTSAVCNSAEYAAQCAYLISLAEKNKELASEGLVDVPRLQNLTSSIQDSCYLIMRTNQLELAKEEESKVCRVNQELQQAVKEASARTKDGAVRRDLTERGFKLDLAAKALNAAANTSTASMDALTRPALSAVEAAGALRAALARPALLPAAPAPSPETKAMTDDVIAHSKSLISKTQALIKQVKEADDDDEPMTWVTYNTHRKSIVDAFDALVNSLKLNGKRSGLVVVAKQVEEETDVPKKSFVQIQEETARKWLHRRPSVADVQHSGERAATTLIDIAHNMTEDMKGHEKDEMLNLITESRELVAECSKKYDNDKASLLMDRLRELRRAVERGAVTCVVEDFLHAEEPLADLELFIDAERDEAKRKFLLEKKIAELMSQLGRATRTARLVARAGHAPAADLLACTEQTELLAPGLVQAAMARVECGDGADAAPVVEHYRALLAQYAAALTRVRELCDQAVDPLDFVQTAGETMSRMREESSQHNDPQKCAYTSNAITRLANRVIVVSMSSHVARADPELRAALAEAQDKLAAAAPAPGTRASRLPDWKDTTAEILRTTGEVESALGGENIFKKLPEPDQPIYNAALSLHAAVRGWSARDNEIVAVAKRMAVLMARLSEQMNTDRKRELIATSKSIVTESREVAALAKKLAQECTDVRIKTNLLQVCERIPTISGQLKMLTTVKGSTLGYQGGEEDREAMNMLVTNAQNLMSSVQEVVKAAASASVKIASQRGLKWVRKNY